jgi:hypothetical protein
MPLLRLEELQSLALLATFFGSNLRSHFGQFLFLRVKRTCACIQLRLQIQTSGMIALTRIGGACKHGREIQVD